MNIFKAAFNISFYTFLSRIFGFLRDIAIAYKLGTGQTADIFFIALKIPNFFRRIFAEGAFSQAFVPLFSEILISKNDKQAIKFANQIFLYLLISLIFFIIIFEIFMPYIMAIFAPGFVNIPEKYNQLVFLARITFPYIILISSVSLINGVLNSYKIFIPGSIMPIIYNICLIISLFTLANILDSSIAMAWGLIISGFLQLGFIYFYAFYKKHKIYPKQYPKTKKQIKKFWKILLPAIFGSSIIQLNSWVDIIIASLIPNAVSYIYYSERLIQLPLAIIGISLSTALLPLLSQLIKKNDSKQAITLFNDSLTLSMFFAIPAVVGLFIFNQEIIITLFARGEFNFISVQSTAKMLQIYALAVPSFILIKILLTNFYSRGDTKTPLKISIISLILNLVLNLVLIQFYSFLGIAIATVISSWFNVLLSYIILHKKVYIYITKPHIIKLSKIIAISTLLGLILHVTSNKIGNFYSFSLTKQIIYLTSYIIATIISYFFLSNISKIYRLSEIKKMIKSSY